MKKVKECGKRICRDIKEYFPAVLVFLVYYIIVHAIRAAFCPLINFTGFPCAGCGLTRAFLYIAAGQFGKAAYVNPMSFVIIVFLIYCGYFRYIQGTKIKAFSRLFALLVICMLIFYGIRMYLYFPDRIPYVYTDRNFLSKTLPGYEDTVKKLLQMIRVSRR